MKFVHVPFRGGAQSIADVAAGNTQLVLNGMLATLPLVQAGRLKLIGISKRTRMALLPDAPTIAEQGVKDFESRHLPGHRDSGDDEQGQRREAGGGAGRGDPHARHPRQAGRPPAPR